MTDDTIQNESDLSSASLVWQLGTMRHDEPTRIPGFLSQ